MFFGMRRELRQLLFSTAVLCLALLCAACKRDSEVRDPVQSLDGVVYTAKNTPCGSVRKEVNSGASRVDYAAFGHERDPSLKLQDFGARFYSSKFCRFTGVDPIDHPAASAYAYARGNPVRFVDPDGARAAPFLSSKRQERKLPFPTRLPARLKETSPGGFFDELQPNALSVFFLTENNYLEPSEDPTFLRVNILVFSIDALSKAQKVLLHESFRLANQLPDDFVRPRYDALIQKIEEAGIRRVTGPQDLMDRLFPGGDIGDFKPKLNPDIGQPEFRRIQLALLDIVNDLDAPRATKEIAISIYGELNSRDMVFLNPGSPFFKQYPALGAMALQEAHEFGHFPAQNEEAAVVFQVNFILDLYHELLGLERPPQ